MGLENERGIWFIDTLETVEEYANATTSVCYQFEVNHGRSDLEALHRAIPDMAARIPDVAKMLGIMRERGFDSDGSWDEMREYLKLWREFLLGLGFFLLWDKLLYVAGDKYDSERIRKYLSSVPDSVAFLDWPLSAEINVFGYKIPGNSDKVVFHHVVTWGALLGFGDATGRVFEHRRRGGDSIFDSQSADEATSSGAQVASAVEVSGSDGASQSGTDSGDQLPSNSGNLALHRTFLAAIEELAEPIKRLIDENPTEPHKEPIEILTQGLFLIACHLITVLGSAGDAELRFLRDFRSVFGQSVGGPDGNELADWRRGVASMIVESKPDFQSFDPFHLKIFLFFDEQNGTNYTEKYRTTFLRFATVFLKADGSLSAPEEAALKTLKEVLYAYVPPGNY